MLVLRVEHNYNVELVGTERAINSDAKQVLKVQNINKLGNKIISEHITDKELTTTSPPRTFKKQINVTRVPLTTPTPIEKMLSFETASPSHNYWLLDYLTHEMYMIRKGTKNSLRLFMTVRLLHDSADTVKQMIKNEKEGGLKTIGKRT